MVTVFNPLTGDSQLAVDTDMRVLCLGMTASALVVVGEKIVTWDLPGGDCAPNAGINDSVRTTILHREWDPISHMSISPDFSRIAALDVLNHFIHLQIYDISTGRCLTSAWANDAEWVGFTRDGREVWTTSHDLNHKKGWKIVEDSESGRIRLKFHGFVRTSKVFP